MKKYFLIVLVAAGFAASVTAEGIIIGSGGSPASFYGGEVDERLQLGGIYLLFPQLIAPEAIVAPLEREIKPREEIKEIKPEEVKPREEIRKPVIEEKASIQTATTTSITTTTTLPITLPSKKSGKPPIIDSIKIGNRGYIRGETVIVSDTPTILPSFKSDDVTAQTITLTINKGSSSEKIVSIKDINKALSAGTPEMGKLSPGKNEIEILITDNNGSTSEVIKLLVLSGETKIVDAPLASPSPYSPLRDNNGITIQYTLSANAGIDLYIYSVAGELVKKISCQEGSEGGSAGLNKVKWNGAPDRGGILGNGTYMGTIIARADNKMIGKFKVNVFD